MSDPPPDPSFADRTPPSRVTLVASGLFLFAYVSLQTLVPTYALFADGWFSSIGWTMYTGLREEPGFAVVYDDGTRETLEQIQQRLGMGVVIGSKVDTARFVPPHLCGALPAARTIVIRYARSGNEEDYPCRP